MRKNHHDIPAVKHHGKGGLTHVGAEAAKLVVAVDAIKNVIELPCEVGALRADRVGCRGT